MEEINKITKSIYEIYKKLYELDVNNERKTLKFARYISSLEVALEIESNWYKNITNLEEMVDTYAYDIHESNLDVIINKGNLYERRILNKFFKTWKEPLNNIYTGANTIATDIGLNDVSIRTLNSYPHKLLEALNSEIKYLFMNNLNQSIRYAEPEEKKLLLKVKYDISFIDDTMESYMLKNRFGGMNNFYIPSDILANYYKVNSNYYSMYKNSYISNFVVFDIAKMLQTTDDVYNDKEGFINTFLTAMNIDVCFSKLDIDSIDLLQDSKENNWKQLTNNKKSKRILRFLFKDAEEAKYTKNNAFEKQKQL